MDAILCPKCQGEMDEGFKIHKFVAAGPCPPQRWMPGKQPSSFLWTEEDTAKLRQVKTFCCRECGYLESYAKK